MNKNKLVTRIFWLTVFGITMGYFEAAVVVYLRAIYYPEGFAFPLKPPAGYIIAVEVGREIASILMLISVAYLAGKKFWERFGWFMFSFGIWDLLYYVWLKVLIDWPSSLVEWDVLFLIPLPWIGPVIAPVSIALLMTVFGIIIVESMHKGFDFKPVPLGYLLGVAGATIVLYSFMYDLSATFHQTMPKPYRYELLVIGDLLFVAAFLISYIKGGNGRGNS